MTNGQHASILYVNSTHKWGGVKTWCLRTAIHLQKQGHKVILAGRKGDPFLEACRQADLTVEEISFGASWSPITMTRFVGIIRRHKIQLVVGNVGRDLSTAGVAAKICSCPMIHRVGSIYDFRNTTIRRLVHSIFVQGMLVPAHWMVPALKERFAWLITTDIQASLHSVETTLPFTPRSSLEFSKGENEMTVLILGRVHPEKGQAELLHALEELKQDGYQPHILVVGDGPALEPLREEYQSHFGERLQFIGFTTDVKTYLEKADIGVLFSKHEAVSNVVFEYLAAGLAVLAPDLPGLREVDPRGECVTFVDPQQPQTLTKALRLLLSDHSHRLRLQGLSRQRAENHFSPDQEATRLAQIYQAWINRS
jgi:glycosyltransferase involved in cell wall biosynthesis